LGRGLFIFFFPSGKMGGTKERKIVMTNLQFEPLSLEKADDYLELYRSCPRQSSYYSFGSLWAWRKVFGLSWAFARGMCWIRSRDDTLWSPVGPWGDADWRSIMPEIFPGPAKLHYAPDGLARVLTDLLRDRITAREVRSQWEYLHSVKELIALKGNRFSNKRGHIRQFTKNFDYEYRPLGPDDRKVVVNAQRQWLAERNESDALLRETEAVKEMMAQWRHIPGLMGGILEVKGAPAAYTIAEVIAEDTVMIHFEKALSAYGGAYQAINRMFLQNSASSFATVNREEDLGDEGMRVAKMSYHPVGFLKKYTLSWFPD
jgi:hypothetical protein